MKYHRHPTVPRPTGSEYYTAQREPTLRADLPDRSPRVDPQYTYSGNDSDDSLRVERSGRHRGVEEEAERADPYTTTHVPGEKRLGRTAMYVY